MSEPTYRIVTSRRPGIGGRVWEARVQQLSDGEWKVTVDAYNEPDALIAARQWIVWENTGENRAGGVYYANEDGTLATSTPAPEASAVPA